MARGAVRHYALHNPDHHLRGPLADDLSRFDLRLIQGSPVLGYDLLDDMRFDPHAAIGDRAGRGDDLQQRDRNLLADGDRADRIDAPVFERIDNAPRFARQFDPGLPPEAEARDVFEEFLPADSHGDADRAAVRRLGEGVFDRQIAVGVRVAYDALADGDLSAAAIDHVVRLEQTLFERGRVGHDLEDRAWFIRPTDRAVGARRVVRAVGTLVGVEGRDVGEREDLSGLRVHDDRAGAFRARHAHGLVEQDLDLMLQDRVNRQDDLRARRRRRLAPVVGPSQSVSVERDLASLPAQQVVVLLLDAGQPVVVRIDITDHARGQRVVGVETLTLFLNRDPAQTVFGDRLVDRLRGLRVEFAFEPEETRIPGQSLQQFGLIKAEKRGERAGGPLAIGLLLELLQIDIDRIGDGADGKLAFVPVDYRAARGDDLDLLPLI